MHGFIIKPTSIITRLTIVHDISAMACSIFFREIFEVRVGHGKVADHNVQLGYFFSRRKGYSRQNHTCH